MRLSDPQIRETLIAYLETKHNKIRIIEEKEIGASRADLITVTDGVLTGYEIKSDLDSYTRLKSQARDYNKYCDYCVAVVGRSHQTGVLKHIPEFWGVLTVYKANGTFQVDELRPAAVNPKATANNKLKLLWKRELQNIAGKHKLNKHLSKKGLLTMIQQHLPPEKLALAFTDELFERDYTVWK